MGQRYLYWSTVELYEECPQLFLWRRGQDGIDLGNGPGKPKTPTDPSSEHNALMGDVIGKAVEELYNKELWRDPANLRSVLETFVRREFTFALGERSINWAWSPSREDLLQTCLDGVSGYLRTMKANRLLGPYAAAEVPLRTWLDAHTPIAGRPDIIVRRADTGVIILDGKNSKNPGRHTKPDQLRWYALCFYLKHNVLPERLAFVYYRYPVGNPPPPEGKAPPVDPAQWTGLVEVPLVREDLQQLGVRAKKTQDALRRNLFEPTPSPATCQYCEFQSTCGPRMEQKAANAARRKTHKGASGSEPSDLMEGATGLVELGFGKRPSST